MLSFSGFDVCFGSARQLADALCYWAALRVCQLTTGTNDTFKSSKTSSGHFLKPFHAELQDSESFLLIMPACTAEHKADFSMNVSPDGGQISKKVYHVI